MPTNTIRLHRVLHTAPEKIYRAFLDPDAMAKWLPPNGFTGKVHEIDPKWVAATGCRGPISRPARATPSAAPTAIRNHHFKPTLEQS